MFEYMLVAALIAVAAVLLPTRRPHPVLWGAAFVLLVLFVGLRHKVGMDWNNYLVMIARASEGSWWESLSYAEPAYATLLWISSSLDVGIYGANLVGALLLMLGIFRFSARTPLPWMALATAMPFLIVVVGMSANRQAIAIGILMWLVAGWEQYNLKRRVLLVGVAALFHFSAIFFLLFAVLGLRVRAAYKLVLAVVMFAITAVFLQYSGGGDYYDQSYVSGQSELTYSPGAILHVLLNGVPAALVMARKGIRDRLFPSSLLVQMAWLALALVPVSFVFSSAASRMTLYLFPVSMYALSALSVMLASGVQRAALRTLLASFMAGLLWFWLAFANSSNAHIPYENALLMDSRELHL